MLSESNKKTNNSTTHHNMSVNQFRLSTSSIIRPPQRNTSYAQRAQILRKIKQGKVKSPRIAEFNGFDEPMEIQMTEKDEFHHVNDHQNFNKMQENNESSFRSKLTLEKSPGSSAGNV